MSFPADAIGHHLDFQWRDHEGYFQRLACCSAEGCEFVAVAPGSGYARGRQLHTEAHHHLTWLCDRCGAMAALHDGNRCPDTEATP